MIGRYFNFRDLYCTRSCVWKYAWNVSPAGDDSSKGGTLGEVLEGVQEIQR